MYTLHTEPNAASQLSCSAGIHTHAFSKLGQERECKGLNLVTRASLEMRRAGVLKSINRELLLPYSTVFKSVSSTVSGFSDAGMRGLGINAV